MFAFLFKLFLVAAGLACSWYAGKYLGLLGRWMNGVDAAPQADAPEKPEERGELPKLRLRSRRRESDDGNDWR